jgi:hypothetical protein
MANPSYPESVSRTVSMKQNDVPALAGAPPLVDEAGRPVQDGIVSATQISQRVTSPNAERLREGMPVEVTRDQQDGSKLTEKVSYPKQPSLGNADVVITDTTEAAMAAWGIKDEPEEPANGHTD